MALPRLLSRPVRRHGTAAAVTLLAALALAGCAGDGTRPSSADATGPAGGRGSATAESRQQDGGGSASPTSSPSEEAPESADTTVPVYWVGDGPGGRTVLFREFHRVSGDPLTEAARLVTSGTPDDPDYRTLFPGGDVASVTASDGLLVVELADDGWATPAPGMDRAAARAAVQQLVYTLQGVQQERVPVQVLLGGEPTTLFGLDTSEPFTAASALRTLNLVSITSPEEGATVTGDTLTVTGVASSFEASGPCRLLRDDEELALVGYQADGWLDRLYPFEAQLPLDGVTGEVTLQCETDDPSGGAEGSGPAIDTRTITVAG